MCLFSLNHWVVGTVDKDTVWNYPSQQYNSSYVTLRALLKVSKEI